MMLLPLSATFGSCHWPAAAATIRRRAADPRRGHDGTRRRQRRRSPMPRVRTADRGGV